MLIYICIIMTNDAGFCQEYCRKLPDKFKKFQTNRYMNHDNNLTSTLSRRVVIQSPVRTRTVTGGFTKAWNDFASVYADVEPVSARERLIAFKMQGEITHKITIRFLSGVKSRMRVVYNSRIFNIRGVVNPSEKNERLVLLCEEGVDS